MPNVYVFGFIFARHRKNYIMKKFLSITSAFALMFVFMSCAELQQVANQFPELRYFTRPSFSVSQLWASQGSTSPSEFILGYQLVNTH